MQGGSFTLSDSYWDCKTTFSESGLPSPSTYSPYYWNITFGSQFQGGNTPTSSFTFNNIPAASAIGWRTGGTNSQLALQTQAPWVGPISGTDGAAFGDTSGTQSISFTAPTSAAYYGLVVVIGSGVHEITAGSESITSSGSTSSCSISYINGPTGSIFSPYGETGAVIWCNPVTNGATYTVSVTAHTSGAYIAISDYFIPELNTAQYDYLNYSGQGGPTANCVSGGTVCQYYAYSGSTITPGGFTNTVQFCAGGIGGNSGTYETSLSMFALSSPYYTYSIESANGNYDEAITGHYSIGPGSQLTCFANDATENTDTGEAVAMVAAYPPGYLSSTTSGSLYPGQSTTLSYGPT